MAKLNETLMIGVSGSIISSICGVAATRDMGAVVSFGIALGMLVMLLCFVSVTIANYYWEKYAGA